MQNNGSQQWNRQVSRHDGLYQEDDSVDGAGDRFGHGQTEVHRFRRRQVESPHASSGDVREPEGLDDARREEDRNGQEVAECEANVRFAEQREDEAEQVDAELPEKQECSVHRVDLAKSGRN